MLTGRNHDGVRMGWSYMYVHIQCLHICGDVGLSRLGIRTQIQKTAYKQLTQKHKCSYSAVARKNMIENIYCKNKSCLCLTLGIINCFERVQRGPYGPHEALIKERRRSSPELSYNCTATYGLLLVLSTLILYL